MAITMTEEDFAKAARTISDACAQSPIDQAVKAAIIAQKAGK